jgi:hypothetical protein
MHHADDERTQLTINELLSYVRTIARSMRHSEEHMPFYFTFCAWNRKPSPGVFVRGAPLWLRLGLGGGVVDVPARSVAELCGGVACFRESGAN